MKTIQFFLILGLLVIVSCSKDNLEPITTKDHSFSSFTELSNSGIDLNKLTQPSSLKSFSLMNTRADAVTFYSDPDDFGCDSLPVEDFEEAPDLDLIPLNNPLNALSDNDAFSPGDILPGISMYSSADHDDQVDLVLIGPDFFGSPSQVLGPNFYVDSLIIDFSAEGIYAVSMDILLPYGDDPISVLVFGASGLLGSTTVPAVPSGYFLGLKTTEPITRIVVGSPKGELIDNLSFGVCDIIIDGCLTGVGEYVFEDGDTMTGLIMECAEDAVNHGQFVSCVSHLTNEWKKAGLITGEQKDAIMDCAGAADLPE